MGLFSFKFKWLLLFLGIAPCYFTFSVLTSFVAYSKLKALAPVQITEWRVVQKGSSSFAIEAAYTFEAKGKAFQGKTLFAKPYHLNLPSAERQVKEFSTRSWSVWYSPTDPSFSALERNLPVKKIVYAVMALGVFGYFLALGFLRQNSHTA
jgi:hypothetical protein